MWVAMCPLVKRTLCGLALASCCVFPPKVVRAEGAVLIAASDPKLVSEVELAKVMADDASLWLSVRAKGHARLAVVSATSSVETTASSDTWLRALDFTTRVHVAPPPGPLAACPNQSQFPAADSGLPESDVSAAEPVANVDSELELKRSLANAGIAVDASDLDAFTVDASPPFQISWFEVGSNGASSSALRLQDPGPAGALPKIRVAGLDSVPLTLIALARDGVLPLVQEAADPSEFAVTYFAADTTTDYAAARASWRLANADRWLVEAAESPVLFDGTVARAAALDSVKVDLADSVRQLGVDDIRLSRLFGSLTAAGATFRLAESPRRDPLVVATDFDTTRCSPAAIDVPSAGAPRAGATPPGRSPAQPLVDQSGDPTTVVVAPGDGNSDGSGVAVVVDTSDSCGNDPNTPAPGSNEACSGDSSSSDSSSSDSCSGDSSSDDSKEDSCSGDSNSNSKDSPGCGSSSNSGYDGDTCTGNSATGKSSAALESGGTVAARRPRRVRLSLLTLLAAGLSLPLRRRVK
jgi:hypothetical protein